jgi:hypothetical protein
MNILKVSQAIIHVNIELKPTFKALISLHHQGVCGEYQSGVTTGCQSVPPGAHCQISVIADNYGFVDVGDPL